MKPNNETYYNLDSEIDSPYVHWDMSNGDEIVVHDLITYGEVGSGKEELTALAQVVCDNYEESL